MIGGKLLWKWVQNKSLNILTHRERASLSPLYREPWGEQTLNFCPYLKLRGVSRNMLWKVGKKTLLLSPALWIWKGARKCKPSVRKCKPSVTWVSKKFDTWGLRDADCHIHLTGLWTLKRLQDFSLDHTASAVSSPPASLSLGWASVMWPKLSWRERGHGVGQSLALSLGKEPACFPKKQWAVVKVWPVALVKLLVWALTFYTPSRPKFINLHLVCWTVSAKKPLKRLMNSILAFPTCNILISWSETCSY